DRKVVCLESDGSGMYTVQGLWTMARERLDIVTVLFNNRTYEILKGEFRSDRKIVCLESDGSGMYTLQGLWTMAREGLDVVTVLFNNRTYEILKGEFKYVGAGEAGSKARDMLEIGRPNLDWVSLAKGQGVPATRVETLDALARDLRVALA